MLAEATSTGLDNVVVTGGEPLEHPAFVALVDALKAAGRRTEVETAGTQLPRSTAVDQWNVSLKLAHSGVAAEVRLRADVIDAFCDLPAWFKFVVATENDVKEVLAIQAAHRLPPKRIILMPLGMRREEQQARMPLVIDWCRHHGFRFSPARRLAFVSHRPQPPAITG